MSQEVRVVEAYRNWKPPVKFDKTVANLLSLVPRRYLAGLGSVVLANATGLDHSRRRAKTWSRRHRVRVADCLGLYHQAWQGQPAWIELFVDNILSGQYGRWVPKSAYFRDLVFSSVLYHEIGHHIHHVHVPEFREKENVADAWAKRMTTQCMWHRHWLLMLCLGPYGWLAVRLRRISRWLARGTPVAGRPLERGE